MILFRDVCSTCPIFVFYPLQQKSKQLLAGKTGSAHIMTKVDFPRQFRFPSGIVKLINCTKSTKNFICDKKNKTVIFVPTHVLSIWSCFWQPLEKRRLGKCQLISKCLLVSSFQPKNQQFFKNFCPSH